MYNVAIFSHCLGRKNSKSALRKVVEEKLVKQVYSAIKIYVSVSMLKVTALATC